MTVSDFDCRAVLGKCSSENVIEDDFKACVAKYYGKKDVRNYFEFAAERFLTFS